MNSLVSIIIPTYNRAHLIGQTLDSILNQTYENWECIIVDDGSTDSSDEVINEYIIRDIRFRYYKRPINKKKGPNSCRNYGFEKSKGYYINWFDSDDLYKPNAIETFIYNFSDGLDVIVAGLDKIDGITRKKMSSNVIVSDNLLYDYFVGNVTFYVCGPFWKKSFLEKRIELFDENIRYLDDWDFNLRMLYEEPKIKYIDNTLIYYIIQDSSLSQQVNKLNFEEIDSEFEAREKQLKIIALNKKIDKKKAVLFVKDRYKYVIRDCLFKNSKIENIYVRRILIKQLLLLDFIGLFKIIIGLLTFILFKRGYSFFK